jgi:RNA polymerase sigma-70 factor (ECF subfamily)
MNDKPTATVFSLDPAHEDTLVLAAKSGDEQAFEMLFKRHQRKIFVAALRYTRVPEDAEDIVQQTFQKAFLHLHSFAGKSSFSTWLTRIAINEALMFLRRCRALREVPIDDPREDEAARHFLEIPDSSPDPEATYLKREEAEALSEAIGSLRPSLRIAIKLRDLTELSIHETARRMGISASAVKARVFHGRRKLRERFTLRSTARRISGRLLSVRAGDVNRVCVAGD